MNNTVELIGYYGSDETHACSAWTSTSRDLDEDKKSRIPKLLKDLATNGHHSPFEKSSLHFLVNCDVASHIHILKHRIGVSSNAESARYKELKEDKVYIPNDWNVDHSEQHKCFRGEDFDHILKWSEILELHSKHSNELYHEALKELTPILGRKRAKESARYFKTYNSQIQTDLMFNWRSFNHFQKLRNKPEAQKEIQEIAKDMLELVKNINGNPFKYTIEAFNLCGKL